MPGSRTRKAPAVDTSQLTVDEIRELILGGNINVWNDVDMHNFQILNTLTAKSTYHYSILNPALGPATNLLIDGILTTEWERPVVVAGSIVGVYLKSVAPITASTVNLGIMVNGLATGITLALDIVTPSLDFAWLPPLGTAFPFAPGDLLSAQISPLPGVLPALNEYSVGIVIT